MSIKKLFLFAFSISILLLLILGFLTFKLYQNQLLLNDSQENRYQSYLAATELRQSSDDLTKFARTYVVTANANYEKIYWDILAIRNGTKPRPERYEHIYWDFFAYLGEKPRPNGEMIALKQKMRSLGFTDAEFAKLTEAQNNSNELVSIEAIAMNAVKGLYRDHNGKFTIKGEAKPALAQELMHSKEYHKQKYLIMKPIDDFFVLLSERTQNSVVYYQKLNQIYVWSIIALISLIIIFSAIFYYRITRHIMAQLGGEPNVVIKIIHQLAAGNLSQSFDTQKTLTGLFLTVYQMQQQWKEIVTAITQTAAVLNTTAQEIAQGNMNLNQRVEEQAASLEETAASMNEMTSIVQQSANNTRLAIQLAENAQQHAHKGGEVVNAMIVAMDEINHSSKKIADIISIIDQIAFQTNLLALNAAVEAARAGEQGRGFAVVAAEVRNLAQRSGIAAKEIKELIQESVVRVDEGTVLANTSGKTLQEIIASVKQVDDIIREISTASYQQAAGIQQVHRAITHMDSMTQQNAALVEQTASASEVMGQQVANLANQIAFFNNIQH